MKVIISKNKFKKYTENKNPNVSRAFNRRIVFQASCAVGYCNKSKFIKERETQRLLILIRKISLC